MTQLKKTSVCEVWNKKLKLSRNKERKKSHTDEWHEKYTQYKRGGMKCHSTTQTNMVPWTTFPDISELVASSKVLLYYLTPRSFHPSAAQWQRHCQNQATIVSSFVICVTLRITNHTTSIIEIHHEFPPILNSVQTLMSAIVSKTHVIVFSITFLFSFHPWQPSRCCRAYKTYCRVQGHCSTNGNLYSGLSATVLCRFRQVPQGYNSYVTWMQF